MRNRRPGLSLMMLAGAGLLLIAIAVGQRIGDRVLSQATEEREPIVGPTTTPVPGASSDPLFEKNWKHEQVVSVATDPAFPDPRVTPKPTPKPSPSPSPTPVPATAPGTAGTPAPGESGAGYTSPPLPLPIASHAPDETSADDTSADPAGGPSAPSPPAQPTPR